MKDNKRFSKHWSYVFLCLGLCCLVSALFYLLVIEPKGKARENGIFKMVFYQNYDGVALTYDLEEISSEYLVFQGEEYEQWFYENGVLLSKITGQVKRTEEQFCFSQDEDISYCVAIDRTEKTRFQATETLPDGAMIIRVYEKVERLPGRGKE